MYSILRSRIHLTCAFGLILGSIAGCGSTSDKWTAGRQPVYPVSGKVTYKGEVVAGANVLFFSEGKNLTARAMTDEDGQYELTTYEPRDGAVVGEHAVSIRKTVKEPVQRALDDDSDSTSGQTSRLKDLLPRVYASSGTTTLKANVAEGGSADMNFDLVD